MVASATTPERCPRCDRAFGCAIHSGGCWCAAMTLSADLRAQLATGYDGCLCHACLRELERAPTQA